MFGGAGGCIQGFSMCLGKDRIFVLKIFLRTLSTFTLKEYMVNSFCKDLQSLPEQHIPRNKQNGNQQACPSPSKIYLQKQVAGQTWEAD